MAASPVGSTAMRILHVTAHYPPDFTSGATLQVARLARHMAAGGHDVTVVAGAIAAGLADGESRAERVAGVDVRWIGTAERIMQDDDGNWRNPAAAGAMATTLDDVRPAVVHAHGLQTLGAGVVAAAIDRGIPTVVTMHDMWWWCPRLFLVDRALHPCPIDTMTSRCDCARDAAWRHARAAELAPVLRSVDAILVPSSALRDVVELNGVDPALVSIDDNDVAGEAIGPADGRPHSGDVEFVYVGGDHALKGRDVMLAAASRLASQRRRGWRLTAYGVARGRRRRSRHVRFAPPYDPANTALVFATADVLVIPSIARESYSMVAREALGAGVAVLTSDCLGPEEVVIDGRNGIVVPTGDDHALAAAMDRLIDEPGLLDRLRGAARDDPPSLRDPIEHATSLVERYRALIAGRA